MITTIALDFEGTLVKDKIEPCPRPGLFHFLTELKKLELRICMMTTVTETIFRNISHDLIEQNAAPSWFQNIEYVTWSKCKDLGSIPDTHVKNCILVDDYEGYVCPNQKQNWISIETYFDQGDNDVELIAALKEINHRLNT